MTAFTETVLVVFAAIAVFGIGAAFGYVGGYRAAMRETLAAMERFEAEQSR